MSDVRRWILGIATALALLILAFSPYAYSGYNEMARMTGSSDSQATGTITAPLWAVVTPADAEQRLKDRWHEDTTAKEFLFTKVEEVHPLVGAVGGRIAVLVVATAIGFFAFGQPKRTH